MSERGDPPVEGTDEKPQIGVVRMSDVIMVTNSEFLQHLLQAAPRGTTAYVCAFAGNPNSDDANWAGRPYNVAMHAGEVDGWGGLNTYFSVASVGFQGGTIARRKTHFARLLALVADDVDPADLMATPSWGIETSPGKRQVGILLDGDDPDCADLDLVTRVVTAMADRGLISADKSGNNAVRYVRLPDGVNGKPRPSGLWTVNVEYWNPAVRMTLQDAVAVFGLNLDTLRHEQSQHLPASTIVSGEQDERLRTLTGNILRGEALHDSINVMAASLVACGTRGGAAVNLLRALMEASSGPRDDRWEARYRDIPRSVATAEAKFRAPPQALAAGIGSVDPATGEITPHRPLFTAVHELLHDIRPVDWLIEGYLETDALSMLYGPSGSGKSFVAVAMAASISTGAPWHGCQVKPGPVFYVAGEGHSGLARRFAAWSKATGVPIDRDTPLFKSNRAVPMLDKAAAEGLRREVSRMASEAGQAPRLVIVDTLARNFGAGDENKQADANAFIEALDEIRREYACHVMAVHHSGHEQERARGSTVFRAAMDQELAVRGQGASMELLVTKMKDAEQPAPRRFKISQIGLGVIDDCGVEITGAHLEVDGNPLDFRVGTATSGGAISALQVARAMHPAWPGGPAMAATLKCSERSLSRIMRAMKDQGLAVQAPSKQAGWSLSEAAIDHLSMTGSMLFENHNGEGDAA